MTATNGNDKEEREESGVKLEDIMHHPRRRSTSKKDRKNGGKKPQTRPSTEEKNVPTDVTVNEASASVTSTALVISTALEQATYAVIADNAEIMRLFGFRMPEPQARVFRHIVFAMDSRDYEVDGVSYTGQSQTSLAVLDDGTTVEVELALVWAVKLCPGIVYPGILIETGRWNRKSHRKIYAFWPLGIGNRTVLERYNKHAGPDPFAHPIFPLPIDDVEFRKIGSTPTLDLYIRKVRTIKRRKGEGDSALLVEWRRVGYVGSKPVDLVDGSNLPPEGEYSRFAIEEKRGALRGRYIGPATQTEGLRLANPMAMAEMVLPKPDPFRLFGITKERIGLSEVRAVATSLCEGRIDVDHHAMRAIAELGYEVPPTAGARRKLLKDLIPSALEAVTTELRMYGDEIWKACATGDEPMQLFGIGSVDELDARVTALKETIGDNDPIVVHMNVKLAPSGVSFDNENPTHRSVRTRIINAAAASIKRKERDLHVAAVVETGGQLTPITELAAKPARKTRSTRRDKKTTK